MNSFIGDGSTKTITIPNNVDLISNIFTNSNIQIITFGKNFNRNINNVIFPNTLTELIFYEHFNQNLDNIKLPQSLRSFLFFNHKISS